jgi:hypothetical protein
LFYEALPNLIPCVTQIVIAYTGHPIIERERWRHKVVSQNGKPLCPLHSGFYKRAMVGHKNLLKAVRIGSLLVHFHIVIHGHTKEDRAPTI